MTMEGNFSDEDYVAKRSELNDFFAPTHPYTPRSQGLHHALVARHADFHTKWGRFHNV